MKRLLFLLIFFPLLLGAQDQEQTKEYLFYHIRNYYVQTSLGSNYLNNGVGIRRSFNNEMEVIAYFQSLGWHFDENRGPRYSFSKDVTGWTPEQVKEFLAKVEFTKERRSVQEIYSESARKRLYEKARDYYPIQEIKELLKSLQNEKEIDVSIKFSQAIIHGKSEADFVYIEDVSSEEDWITLWENEYKPGLFRVFLEAFNTYMFDAGYKIRFGSFEQSQYQIKLIVSSISENGSVLMSGFINNRDQEATLCELTIIGNGGTFGTIINLMGDGFKRAGIDIAKQMITIFERGKVSVLKKGRVPDEKWAPF